MQSHTSHLSSTRLENLALEPGAAKFDLEGRAVKISGDAGAPSVAALQAFHQSAVADYQMRAPAVSDPGWLSRMRSWLGRFFGPMGRSGPAGPIVTGGPVGPAAPALRTAFGDKDGVHVIWQTPPKLEAHRLTSPLDSPLADRLQDCYGHLAKLGYNVVGLEPLRAGPEKHPPPPVSPAGKKERTIVVSLNPDPSPARHRAPDSPREDAEKIHVLGAPEKLLRTLQAAADPGRPLEDRLTFLRCSLGKSGLKIIDVGLGNDKEHGPARWEDAGQWLALQSEPEAPAKKARPAAAVPAAAARAEGPEP